MDCAICCNQQQINVAMVMIQVYFGWNCIEHFKGFNSMHSFPYQMWVLMSAFFSFKIFCVNTCTVFCIGTEKVTDSVHFDELV